MNEKLQSLLLLLDDPDEEVFHSVREELLKIGKENLYSLEAYYQTTQDTIVKERLDAVFREIKHAALIQKIYQWRLSGGEDLLEGWLLLNQYYYPQIPTAPIRNKISGWIHQIWLSLHPAMDIPMKMNKILEFINNHLQFQIKPEPEVFNEPDFMFLHYLLSHKNGNSLSLSMFINALFNALDIQSHILNFNGYFAIRYYDQKYHVYVDVFNSYSLFSAQEVKLFLEKVQLDTNLMHYKPQTNIYLILNMLEKLKELYDRNGNNELYHATQDLLKAIEIQIS